jgi:hypothetical protein
MSIEKYVYNYIIFVQSITLLLLLLLLLLVLLLVQLTMLKAIHLLYNTILFNSFLS